MNVFFNENIIKSEKKFNSIYSIKAFNSVIKSFEQMKCQYMMKFQLQT